MDTDKIQELGVLLSSGQISLEEFQQQITRLKNQEVGFVDTGDTLVDLDRKRRCGFPEVIYSEGKSVETIRRIVQVQRTHGTEVFATRMSQATADILLNEFDGARYNPVARTFRIPVSPSVPLVGKVAILTAGTTDLPVAEEARETVLWTGTEVVFIQDVGVAGPHRLMAKLPLLKDVDVLIVIAGMEGALPGVVGGFVDLPVIAVPTSVGYGANFGGISALLGMLNSCSSNVVVVNIDAGFKAGYIAGLIAHRCHDRRSIPDK